MIYFADFMYRVWGQFNQSFSAESLTTSHIVEFHFPKLDQKISGSWVAYVLLYDDANSNLVSYNAKEFLVTDSPPIPFWFDPIFYVLIFYVVIIVVFIKYQNRVKLYFEKRSKTKAKKNQKRLS